MCPSKEEHTHIHTLTHTLSLSQRKRSAAADKKDGVQSNEGALARSARARKGTMSRKPRTKQRSASSVHPTHSSTHAHTRTQAISLSLSPCYCCCCSSLFVAALANSTATSIRSLLLMTLTRRTSLPSSRCAAVAAAAAALRQRRCAARVCLCVFHRPTALTTSLLQAKLTAMNHHIDEEKARSSIVSLGCFTTIEHRNTNHSHTHTHSLSLCLSRSERLRRMCRERTGRQSTSKKTGTFTCSGSATSSQHTPSSTRRCCLLSTSMHPSPRSHSSYDGAVAFTLLITLLCFAAAAAAVFLVGCCRLAMCKE